MGKFIVVITKGNTKYIVVVPIDLCPAEFLAKVEGELQGTPVPQSPLDQNPMTDWDAYLDSYKWN